MKKLAAVLILLSVMLTGCFSAESEIERAMRLRTKLLNAESCSFAATITADYGDKLYTFAMDCQGSGEGDLSFTVCEPEGISGITGQIAQSKGKLTFDDKALFFPLMADGLISPVSGPWILLKTLRGGYIRSAGSEGELLHLTIDDSYSDDALMLDIWLDDADRPVRAEILHKGRRYLTLEIRDFQIL